MDEERAAMEEFNMDMMGGGAMASMSGMASIRDLKSQLKGDQEDGCAGEPMDEEAG